MARHRSHSVEFKRQVALEFLAGETLHGLAKRHDISRNLIRIWVEKYEAGAFEDDARAADLIQAYEARIAALERLVGKQALEQRLLARQLLRPLQVHRVVQDGRDLLRTCRFVRLAHLHGELRRQLLEQRSLPKDSLKAMAPVSVRAQLRVPA